MRCYVCKGSPSIFQEKNTQECGTGSMILWRRFIANVRLRCQGPSTNIPYSTHINYTLNVHLSGLFLPWHRHFLWLWEKALREECGYPGHLP